MTPATFKPPSDRAKQEVWASHNDRQPTRVPVTLWTNSRVVVLNKEWNPGYTYEQVFTDPRAHVETQLAHGLYRRRVLHRYCDSPTALPDIWRISLDILNVYEAAYFGAPISYHADQIPDTLPPFANEADKEAIFDVDIADPLNSPFIKHWLAFREEMVRIAADLTFEGRPVEVQPWAPVGSDGPVTVAMNLRGAAFMLDMAADPDYADRVLAYLIDAAIYRRRELGRYWQQRGVEGLAGANWLADDSCAMLSEAMYRQRVAPLHRKFYEASAIPDGERSMHLCGDAQRLFPIVQEHCGVTSFDTGFPVDHGRARQQLGPDTLICGGPQIALFQTGSPDAIYQCTVEILHSGVTEGGRFVLREGNNLPPNVPEQNLQAMYAACLEHGRYDN